MIKIFKPCLTLLAAVSVALVVLFVVPLSATDTGTNIAKKAIAFSTVKVGSIDLNLSVLFAILVTVQGFLIALASVSLLSQVIWHILSRSTATMNILDATLRHYPKTLSIFFKQPFKKTSAVVLLALLPLAIDAVQHTFVQTLIVRGVVDNLGSIQYSYLNTSTIKPQYEPLVSEDGGYAVGFSPIAAISAENGLSAVAYACSNQTRTCGSQTTNSTTSLIQCNSEEDCTQEITNYHDFDMTCTRNETLMAYPAISSGWLNSTVKIDRFLIVENDYAAVLDWTVRLLRRYDSSESASKQTTTNVDPLSNLNGTFMPHISSSMGYLGLALTKKVAGKCFGVISASSTPYGCENGLYLMSAAADYSRDDNDVALLEQEMCFTVEMMMKQLFVNVMPDASSPATCTACSTRQAQWASMTATLAFFGTILGLVVIFCLISIYVKAVGGHDDSGMSSDKRFSLFSVPDGHHKISLVEGRIVVDDKPKEQRYLMA
ncbi:hypothetical protein BJ741DRAFT_573741 [Chytriomyces cf. hyalinus JEL632]|nr:hypothetical protein BJ741DRAFT_573741 [Chytriomyces cf. hyalinus JEL632]